MEGVIGLIVLVGLLFLNYNIVNSATENIKNRKLRSLIMSIANFLLVMLFVVVLPMVGGYTYDSFQDVLNVLFSEGTAAMLTITIIGFSIAIIYFSVGAYSIWFEDRIKSKISYYKDELIQLEKQVQSIENIAKILMLIEQCDINISAFTQNPEIDGATKIIDTIKDKRDKIDILESKLQNH